MLTIRAASLTGFAELAHSLGLDGRAMLARAGLRVDLLSDPERRIPAEPVARLLETAARASHCDNFGLLLSEYRTFASLGPIAVLLERLPNLREVVRACIEYQRYLADILDMSLDESPDGYCFRLGLLPGPWPVQVGDMMLAMSHKVLTGASGGRWRPETVHAARAVPDDIAPWRRIFGGNVEFDSEFFGFAASRETMEASNPLADEVMAAHARNLLSQVQLGGATEGFVERVRRAIGTLLAERRATVGEVAVRLGLSPRALQRKLAGEGERFDALLDEVRRDLATGYLAGTTLRITTIAALCGYDSPGSFSRWFAGAFGMSPTEWRLARQQEKDEGFGSTVP